MAGAHCAVAISCLQGPKDRGCSWGALRCGYSLPLTAHRADCKIEQPQGCSMSYWGDGQARDSNGAWRIPHLTTPQPCPKCSKSSAWPGTSSARRLFHPSPVGLGPCAAQAGVPLAGVSVHGEGGWAVQPMGGGGHPLEVPGTTCGEGAVTESRVGSDQGREPPPETSRGS